jgi:uncharacterized protein (DUF302 family)
MLKNIYGLIRVLVLLIIISTFSQAKTENRYFAKVYTFDNVKEDDYSKIIEKKLKTIGYNSIYTHKKVNEIYKKRYGSTKFDLLSFSSVVNEDIIKPMFNTHPRLAAFNPFNLIFYKKKGDKVTNIVYMTPEVILDIVHIDDKKIRADYIKSFESLDKLFKEELGGKISYIDIENPIVDSTIINYEIPFKLGWDKSLENLVEDFQSDLQKTFQDRGYTFTGFKNFKGLDENNTLASFDAFWTYSFTNIKDSYKILDSSNGKIESGLFTPNSMYMYIEKGSSIITIGIPSASYMGSMLGIKDKKSVDIIKTIDTQISTFMSRIDAKEIRNKVNYKRSVVVIPTPPKPIASMKIVTVGGSELKSRYWNRLSTEIPEGFYKKKKVKKEEKEEKDVIGLAKNGRVSAYLRGNLIASADAQKRLESAGFKLLSVSVIDKKKLLTSIVFTNDALQSLADKKGRGFMSNLRLLVDKDNKQISITNPFYFSRAFMQDENDEKIIKDILSSITKEFTELKNSKDAVKYTLLPKYQFMASMPYYKDMIVVGKEKTNQKLLEKVKAYKGGKHLIFTQVLSKDRIVIGVKLRKRTAKFIKKIGTHNASLLPHPILIENGVAKILDPKYYISVSYPLLKMSQFMKIATVPDAIEADCKKFLK